MSNRATPPKGILVTHPISEYQASDFSSIKGDFVRFANVLRAVGDNAQTRTVGQGETSEHDIITRMNAERAKMKEAQSKQQANDERRNQRPFECSIHAATDLTIFHLSVVSVSSYSFHHFITDYFPEMRKLLMRDPFSLRRSSSLRLRSNPSSQIRGCNEGSPTMASGCDKHERGN